MNQALSKSEIWINCLGKAIHTDDSSFSRIRMINYPDYKGDLRTHVIQEDIHLLHQVLSPSEYFYEFDKKIFQAGEVRFLHLSMVVLYFCCCYLCIFSIYCLVAMFIKYHFVGFSLLALPFII